MVENYSNDYDVKCELHKDKTYPTITDSERGEIYDRELWEGVWKLYK